MSPLQHICIRCTTATLTYFHKYLSLDWECTQVSSLSTCPLANIVCSLEPGIELNNRWEILLLCIIYFIIIIKNILIPKHF